MTLPALIVRWMFFLLSTATISSIPCKPFQTSWWTTMTGTMPPMWVVFHNLQSSRHCFDHIGSCAHGAPWKICQQHRSIGISSWWSYWLRHERCAQR
jgi:hypothetical protein